MKSIKFSESILINKEQAVVFDFTQDYDNRLKWDKFLKNAVLINGALTAEKGAKSFCVAQNGIGIESMYVTYSRPRVTAVKMTKGPFMFSSFLGSWTFKEISEGVTEVIFLYSFSLRFPFSIFTLFIKNNLQKNVKQRLINLKISLEQ